MRLVITLTTLLYGLNAFCNIKERVNELEKEYDIPHSLMQAVVETESSYNPKAINKKTQPFSYGLGQITPETAIGICGLQIKNLLNIEKNLKCTAIIISELMRKYDFNISSTLSAYNMGTSCKCDRKRFRYETNGKICSKKKCDDDSYSNQKYIDRVRENLTDDSD